MCEQQVERPFIHSLSAWPSLHPGRMPTLGLQARLLATHHCAVVETGPTDALNDPASVSPGAPWCPALRDCFLGLKMSHSRAQACPSPVPEEV